MPYFGWFGNHDAPQTPLHLLGPPKLQIGPDYAGLIEILLNHRPIPDPLGELRPSPKEAAKIRRCGFHARARRLFLIPRLPEELVWFTELSHLSDRIDPFWYPAGWKRERAAAIPLVSIDPLSRRERQILGLLRNAPDNRRTRTQLLQSTSRWASADRLDRMLGHLAALDRITMDDDGWIYPYSPRELEAIRRRARERRLKPIRLA
jgi:hypothetical protein